jgi:hypothetical protein
MEEILSINFNKSIHNTFNGEFFNQGSRYYAPYQRELSELKPLETLLEVYTCLNDIENDFEYVVDFKEYIRNKNKQHIIGMIDIKFDKDEEVNSLNIYHGQYMFFIELLYRFSSIYFQSKDNRIYRIIEVLRNESNNIQLNPYSHVFLKDLNNEFKKYESSLDIRDFIRQSMKLLFKNKSIEFNNKIFRTMDAQKWFIKALLELNAVRMAKGQYEKVRGVGSKVNAIFSNPIVKEKILVYGIQVNNYLEYLNSTFNTKIKDKSKFSKTNTQDENKVKELISYF